jgi:hypothetical protein
MYADPGSHSGETGKKEKEEMRRHIPKGVADNEERNILFVGVSQDLVAR